jgi:hypothetical protein
MNDRIRTLLLEANGTHWAAVAIDTVGQGLLTRRNSPAINRSPLLRKLFGNRYGDASYMTDWRDAFDDSDALAVDRCNITNLLEFRSNRPRIRDYDFVVVLHSAAGDRMGLLNRAAQWFQDRRGKLAVFIGNEYDLMDEKIAFVRSSGADYVCSQLIGDRERTRIVQLFADHGPARGLRCDIRSARMPRDEWAAYLNTCHGIVGAESGTYYLQRNGEALSCAKAYLKQQPSATFDEVHQRCFAGPGPFLNGKAISSRHFEPIGTRTCQLLVEGSYNGILEPDRHYISVRRDLSNIDDAIARFKDPAYRAQICERAYDHVQSGHTYAHRIRALVESVFGSSRNGRAA